MVLFAGLPKVACPPQKRTKHSTKIHRQVLLVKSTFHSTVLIYCLPGWRISFLAAVWNFTSENEHVSGYIYGGICAESRVNKAIYT